MTSVNRCRCAQCKALVVLETTVVEQLIEHYDTSSHNPPIGYQRAQYEYRSGIDVRVHMQQRDRPRLLRAGRQESTPSAQRCWARFQRRHPSLGVVRTCERRNGGSVSSNQPLTVDRHAAASEENDGGSPLSRRKCPASWHHSHAVDNTQRVELVTPVLEGVAAS